MFGDPFLKSRRMAKPRGVDDCSANFTFFSRGGSINMYLAGALIWLPELVSLTTKQHQPSIAALTLVLPGCGRKYDIARCLTKCLYGLYTGKNWATMATSEQMSIHTVRKCVDLQLNFIDLHLSKHVFIG